MTSDAVGFTPSEKCPNCGLTHKVQFFYKDTPVIVCPWEPTKPVIFSNEAETLAFLEYLNTVQRVVDARVPQRIVRLK